MKNYTYIIYKKRLEEISYKHIKSRKIVKTFKNYIEDYKALTVFWL